MMPDLENIGLRWRRVRFNPLRSLTSERLASALDQSAAGWLREAALIYETIEKRDAIVHSVMSKRRSAVARRDWQVIIPDPTNPNAAAHKATLEYFYNNLTVTDCTDGNVRTGMSGLFRQMMDAAIQSYSVHEIIYQPTADGLTAELRRVPLYFFENRSGKLRFVGPETRADGIDLDEAGWMVTVTEGLGEALSICYMFKRLAVQDLMAFSEKFSIPGVLGRTQAKDGSDEGNSMRDTVLRYASEWVGVIYGDDGSIKDPISVVNTPNGANLPPMEISKYMDQMIAMLVRGGDLATLSQKMHQGASLQSDETATLVEDDCALISETLQIQIDRPVLRMVHGDEPPAAYIVVNAPSDKDLVKDIAIDTGLLALGVVQDGSDLAERYGREMVRMIAPTAATSVSAPAVTSIAAANERNRAPAGWKHGGKFMPAAAAEAGPNDTDLQGLCAALASDLQPLGDALLQAVQTQDDAGMRRALKKISARMPEFLDAPALSQWLGKQFTTALTTEPKPQ